MEKLFLIARFAKPAYIMPELVVNEEKEAIRLIHDLNNYFSLYEDSPIQFKVMEIPGWFWNYDKQELYASDTLLYMCKKYNYNREYFHEKFNF